MKPIVIEIPGRPVPKYALSNRSQGGRYLPPVTRKWQEDASLLARLAMRGKEPLSGPVGLELVAQFRPPRSWPTWKKEAALNGLIAHTGKPDEDNLKKAGKDALNRIVFVDDAQVCSTITRKVWGLIEFVRLTVIPILDQAPAHVTSQVEFRKWIGAVK